MVLLCILPNVDISCGSRAIEGTTVVFLHEFGGAQIGLWVDIWHAELVLGNNGTNPLVSSLSLRWELRWVKTCYVYVVFCRWRRVTSFELIPELSHEYLFINFAEF